MRRNLTNPDGWQTGRLIFGTLSRVMLKSTLSAQIVLLAAFEPAAVLFRCQELRLIIMRASCYENYALCKRIMKSTRRCFCEEKNLKQNNNSMLNQMYEKRSRNKENSP